VQHRRRSCTIEGVVAEREIVRADPAMRRTVLVVGAGVVVALIVAILSAPSFLGSLGTLSAASPAEAVGWFAAFVVPIVTLTVVAGVDATRRSLSTYRQGRFPPRGMRVLRDTPVVDGRPARALGVLGCTLGVTLLVAALVFAWTSYRIGAVLWYGCPRATRPA
jgi:hypothetical protein